MTRRIHAKEITMGSHKEWQSTLEEQEKQEKLGLKRKKWHIEQELLRVHEERKLKMIEEYERKRANAMKIDCKQKSLRRSKSSSPQRRETNSSNYEHSKEWKASMTIKSPDDTVIDKRELHKIKISIYKESSLSTKNQSTSQEIERNIINPDDIILPRRSNEGSRPIFERNEIKKAEETRTITFSQDEQLEKQLSSMKNVYICRRSLDDDITEHYNDSSPYKRTIYRTNGNDRYKRDRRRSSSRDSKEKDRGRNERRDRSLSRYSSRNIPDHQSRSHCRSRSHSPTNRQGRERKGNNDKNKFSSRRNYPDRSNELDNRASSESSTNYPSDSFYNPYVYLPRPVPMPRVQAPPMLVPIFPGAFPAPFPSMNMYRWQQPPPRFTYGRGTNRNYANRC